MLHRSATVPFRVPTTPFDAPCRASTSLGAALPHARADDRSSEGVRVIHASAARLVTKERRLSHLLSRTLAAGVDDGITPPAVLVEAVGTFAGHADALGTLYSGPVFRLARGMDRLRLAVVSGCAAVASKLLSHGFSYSVKLVELYAAASEISIGYVALQATALSLGDRCAAAVAARHLRHVGQLLLTLHDLVPFEAVRALHARGLNANTDALWEVAGVSASA